jgi:protein gp37
MGHDSKIEWCDDTWNPAVGCTKVSAGCRGCYMSSGRTLNGRTFDARPSWPLEAP